MIQQRRSLADLIARLPTEEDRRLAMSLIPLEAAAEAMTDARETWLLRRAQRLPVPLDGSYSTFMLSSGRGGGKTHTLATACNWLARRVGTMAVMGATSDDTRRVLIDGPSGILARATKDLRPVFKKQERVLVFPNGARAYLYSAVEPDRLRGSNNAAALCDELAAWADAEECWTQLQLTLRAITPGMQPFSIVATTPRPTPLIRRLMSDPKTFLVNESTYVNQRNLAQTFIKTMLDTYQGTRIGKQELEGAILNEVEMPLWRDGDIHYCEAPPALSDIRRVVIGVDPAVGGQNADQCGISAVAELSDRTCLVLDDATCSGSPEVWASAVVVAFNRWKADLVVAEVNNGGQLVTSILHNIDASLPVRQVSASRGKAIRAEPVSMLYEQGRVRHLRPFRDLETQMLQFSRTGYTGPGSPDRVEALVWAITELSAGRRAPSSAQAPSLPRASGAALPA